MYVPMPWSNRSSHYSEKVKNHGQEGFWFYLSSMVLNLNMLPSLEPKWVTLRPLLPVTATFTKSAYT